MSADKELVLTEQGFKRIREELDHLRLVHRKEIADRIRDSKEYGELSENSEYEDAKTEQAFVEGRILELKHILQTAYVVTDSEISTDVVGVGCKVKVHDLGSDDEWVYSIVGSAEADPEANKISNESPVGEALINHKAGDIVDVIIPAGTAQYKIIEISK
jgi:transcription elongation factor GreA